MKYAIKPKASSPQAKDDLSATTNFAKQS